MSSIKFEQESGGEEIRKMTMQWGYAFAPSVAGRRGKERERFQFSLPNVIKSLIDVAFTLLGAATTAFAVAWAFGLIQPDISFLQPYIDSYLK